jgi:hypothetical protein
VNTRRLHHLPLWFLVALLSIIGLNTSSAAAAGGPETRVRANATVAAESVAAVSSERPASVGRLRQISIETAVGACVATEDDDDGLEHTPTTHPEEFESVRGSKAKRHKTTGEIWARDLLHKDHYEVYKNKKAWEKGNRNRAVWEDGRLKECF